jgi:hypothetical protein
MIEGGRVVQPRQAAPRPDQRLLDGVLGEIRVAGDEAAVASRRAPGARTSMIERCDGRVLIVKGCDYRGRHRRTTERP